MVHSTLAIGYGSKWIVFSVDLRPENSHLTVTLVVQLMQIIGFLFWSILSRQILLFQKSSNWRISEILVFIFFIIPKVVQLTHREKSLIRTFSVPPPKNKKGNTNIKILFFGQWCAFCGVSFRCKKNRAYQLEKKTPRWHQKVSDPKSRMNNSRCPQY